MSSDEPIYVGSDSEDGAGPSSEDLAFSNEDGGAYGGSGDDSGASSMDDDDYGGDMGEPVISTRQVRERKGKRRRSEWSASRPEPACARRCGGAAPPRPSILTRALPSAFGSTLAG